MPRAAFQIVLFLLLAGNIELFSLYRLRADGVESASAWARHDATLGWRVQPNLPRGWYNTTPDVRTNADGLRGEDVAPEKPRHEIRILCLGGSVTFGVGLTEDQTWPQVLERRLQEHAPEGVRIRVINGGQPGFTTAQAAALLDYVEPRYRPDVVIGMFGYNDCIGVDRWNAPVAAARNALGVSATYRYLRSLLVPKDDAPRQLPPSQRGLPASR